MIKNINEIREKKHGETIVSQSDIAILGGVSLKCVQKLEQGDRTTDELSLEKAYRLSLALGCDLQEFIDANRIKDEVYTQMASYISCHLFNPIDGDPKEYAGLIDQLSKKEFREKLLKDKWVANDEDARYLQNVIKRFTKKERDSLLEIDKDYKNYDEFCSALVGRTLEV
ncbi:MAG: helix-turn-helix domain-containing protein [Suipraeoptans sp.]